MNMHTTMLPGVYRSRASDIQNYWPMLTDADLSKVGTMTELAAKVAHAYGVHPTKALHDVQAWAQGRRL